MSRRLVVALAALALPATGWAQRPETRSVQQLRALLARVDTQVAVERQHQRAVDSASASARAGRLASSGDLRVVFWQALPAATANAIVRGADSLLVAGGVVTPAFLRTRVYVTTGIGDTAVLATGDLAGRRRVEIGTLNLRNLRPGSVDPVLLTVSRDFTDMLDAAWRTWLGYSTEFVRPRVALVARGAREELTVPRYTVAERCLAGAAAGCRLLLGLDADTAPFRSRYTAAELREMIARGYGRSPDVARCMQNDDEACYRVAGSGWNFSGVDEVPASTNTRLSIIVAVREIHGPAAMRRALADSVGSLGERIARATGADLDTFVLEWRSWLLAGGRAQHVRAGPGDLLAALAAVGVLLVAATRRGRWT